MSIKPPQRVDYIQVGAHIGNTGNDTLFGNADLSGKRIILIEPVPYLYAALKENYAEKARTNDITFLNIAISNHDGALDLYVPSSANDYSRFPFWANQLASTNPDHARTHLPDLKIEYKKVVCISLNTLIMFENIVHIENLYVDTEGHDYEILMDLDLNHIRPRTIRFEHKHMDGIFTRGPRYFTLLAHFARHGYKLVEEGAEDTVLTLDSPPSSQAPSPPPSQAPSPPSSPPTLS